MDPSVAQWLATAPMFRGLTEHDLTTIAPHTRVLEFARGDVVFAEGDSADRLYLVAAGRVKVCRVTPGGDERILCVFGAGDPLGAVAVYEGKPFPATVVALEPSTCLALDRVAFFALLERSPTLVRGLLLGLTRRLVELTGRLGDLTGGRVEQRFARFFLKLVGEVGRPGSDGIVIPMRLTRQELADLTGTTVETAIRIMSRWGKQRIVRTEPAGFVVLDAEALGRIGDR